MKGSGLMKKVYVKEERCLGCHLCEYYCAFAGSGETDIVKAFKLGRNTVPKVRAESTGEINFAVQCRHCEDPVCVKNCIAGAIEKKNGVVCIDTDKCVGCYTCVLSCPYGCIAIDSEGHTAAKCDLCTRNSCGTPACAANCINGAIVFEERGDE